MADPAPPPSAEGERTGSAAEGGRAEGDETRLAADKSEAIKNQIIQMAGNWGCQRRSESGVTRVDLVLKLGTREIACQIAVTTPIDKEVENLKRCLEAGFEEIALLCDARVKHRSIETRFTAANGDQRSVRFLTVRQFLDRLEEIGEETRKAPLTPGPDEPPKAMPPQPVEISKQERDSVVAEQLRRIQAQKRKAKERGS